MIPAFIRQPPTVKPADPSRAQELAEEMGFSPVLAQLLIHRGLEDADRAQEFLFGQGLLPPEALDEMDKAAEMVAEAVHQETPILVHGDYDADGVTGTALLVWALREMGGRADPYIPHRMDEGYGLSSEGITQAHQDGYKLLVSVDCGSSSPAEIDLAHSLGLSVVITDHHLVRERPPADAFVNPHGPASTCPFPDYAGAGVAYQLARAVAQRLELEEPVACLDLAALGTVADVVPLVGDNRTIVRDGLEVMQGMRRPGLMALMRVTGLAAGILSGEKPLSARSLSHVLAPRINACGRLDHARVAVDLLLEDDPARAEALAREVEQVNQRRREAEAAVREEAEARLAAQGERARTVIVEASADWHPGLVGIVAGRLCQVHEVPAFIISLLEDGSARGSVRAPSNLDVFQCLAECQDLFSHFGGHARAGGFTMRAADLETLRTRLLEVIPRLAGAPQPSSVVDMRLEPSAVTLDLADELEQLAPHGAGNPPPLFLAEGVELAFPEVKKETHLSFQACHGGGRTRCMAFGRADLFPLITNSQRYGLVFELGVNVWNGTRKVEMLVRDVLDGNGVPLVGTGSGAPPAPAPPAPAPPAPAPPAPAPPAPAPPAPAPSAPAPPAPAPPAPAPPAPAPPAPAPPAPAPSAREVSAGCPAGAEILDARAHPNKGRYLADLVATGRSTLVLVRKGLEGFAAGVVAGGRDLAPPPNLVVRNWAEVDVALAGHADARVLGDIEEIAWFTPPPRVDPLRPLLAGPARCHVVFGEEDLDEEARLMKALQVTREIVGAVFRALRALGDGFGANQYRRIASTLAAQGITPDKVRVCVRILCEMGVAQRREDGSYQWTGQKGNLDDSATFCRYCALVPTFEYVKAIFGPQGDVAERLRAGLASPTG